jgi:uncharacterized protein (DUF1499 family)
LPRRLRTAARLPVADIHQQRHTVQMTRIAKILALTGLVVAIGCALAALGAGLGYRFGWWHYRIGIATLGNVFWVAAGTAIVCAVAIVLAAVRANVRTIVIGLAGLGIAGVTAWVPYDLRMQANAVPPIHDITTDLADPPKFVRVAALRKSDDHPAAYDGPKVGEQQKAAYPDLAPLLLKAPRDKVFAAAQVALASMGLEVVEADPAQGRIEATATSMLFGFKDDVVVRISSDAGVTKLDARSKSRVGRNDFGMNAKRIRALQAKVKAAIDRIP